MTEAGKEECPVPDYLTEYLEKYHETLMESVAETSEEFMDRYFEGDDLLRSRGFRSYCNQCTGRKYCSGMHGITGEPSAVYLTFWMISAVTSQARAGRSCNGIAQKTNEIFEANYDFAKAKSAYVFKTIADPFLGKYSLIKVCSGVLKSDDTLLQCRERNQRSV